MKKIGSKFYLLLMIGAVFIIIIGVVFTVFGFICPQIETIFGGIGSGFVSSGIVSLIFETIHYRENVAYQKRQVHYSFKSYSKAFEKLRNTVALVYSRLEEDTSTQKTFKEFLHHDLIASSYDLHNEIDKQFRWEQIYEIVYETEKIDMQCKELLDGELKFFKNDQMIKLVENLPKQRCCIKRIVYAFENEQYDKIEKPLLDLVGFFSLIFPNDVYLFSQPYCKEDL